MNTPEIETISWQEMTGNKYTLSLHPAMLSEQGYIKDKEIRRIGDTSPTLFKVVYNHKYVSGFIITKLCKPLNILGKEKVLELISNAWDMYYGIESSDAVTDRQAS